MHLSASGGGTACPLNTCLTLPWYVAPLWFASPAFNALLLLKLPSNDHKDMWQPSKSLT